MMKNFIINSGRILIDISAWIVAAAILICGIAGLLSDEPFVGLLILLFGTIAFVLTYYILYLFIDIKDKLDIIAQHQPKKEGEVLI